MPVETGLCGAPTGRSTRLVAFTPKGGCPLKPWWSSRLLCLPPRSIHPQGWVPVETGTRRAHENATHHVAFTPKGGCPLKLAGSPKYFGSLVGVAFTPKGGCPLKPSSSELISSYNSSVAFTPKGGCPLKLREYRWCSHRSFRSIHPQGWVPVETFSSSVFLCCWIFL